ncbi:MAG: hypothetical protein V1824_00090 [archaeon]
MNKPTMQLIQIMKLTSKDPTKISERQRKVARIKAKSSSSRKQLNILQLDALKKRFIKLKKQLETKEDREEFFRRIEAVKAKTRKLNKLRDGSNTLKELLGFNSPAYKAIDLLQFKYSQNMKLGFDNIEYTPIAIKDFVVSALHITTIIEQRKLNTLSVKAFGLEKLKRTVNENKITNSQKVQIYELFDLLYNEICNKLDAQFIRKNNTIGKTYFTTLAEKYRK